MQLLKWTALFLAAYAAYAALLFVFQRKIIFPRYMIPSPERDTPPGDSIQQIWLETESGRVEAWFLAPEAADRSGNAHPLVIAAHGNGELIDFLYEEMQPFRKMGMGVLLVEYPGYGRSDGEPSQESIGLVFREAYDRMLERPDVDPGRIVFWGRSLGGGVVCDLSRDRPAAAMVLVSSFTGVREFALRYLLPGFLVRDPFDNLAAVREFQGPVLIFHGRQDEVIPYSHGKRLHDANPGSSFISYDCGHNDCPPSWTEYWKRLKGFLVEAEIVSPGTGVNPTVEPGEA